MELGHLLTLCGLTRLEVSLVASTGFIYLLGLMSLLPSIQSDNAGHLLHVSNTNINSVIWSCTYDRCPEEITWDVCNVHSYVDVCVCVWSGGELWAILCEQMCKQGIRFKDKFYIHLTSWPALNLRHATLGYVGSRCNLWLYVYRQCVQKRVTGISSDIKLTSLPVQDE